MIAFPAPTSKITLGEFCKTCQRPFNPVLSTTLLSPFLIIELDEDYSYTVIGYPSKKYVWIMARDPQMEEKRYNLILDNLSKIGYDISLIQKVPQMWSK